jgi:hypothetical protein
LDLLGQLGGALAVLADTLEGVRGIGVLGGHDFEDHVEPSEFPLFLGSPGQQGNPCLMEIGAIDLRCTERDDGAACPAWT